MMPKRPSQSKAMAWGIWTAAAVVILLLGFSIRSLVMLFVAPQRAGTVGAAAVMPAHEMQDESAKNEEQGAQNHAREAGPLTAPSPAPAAPVRPQKKPSEFTVDYQTLRDREDGRREMIKNLREISRDNPESGYSMTEEQLRKFEQSGKSFK